MHALVGVESHDDAVDKAIQVFVAGLPVFALGPHPPFAAEID